MATSSRCGRRRFAQRRMWSSGDLRRAPPLMSRKGAVSPMEGRAQPPSPIPSRARGSRSWPDHGVTRPRTTSRREVERVTRRAAAHVIRARTAHSPTRLAGVPSGVGSVCEAAAGRHTLGRLHRAVSRRIARRAHVCPMRPRTRVLALPRSTNDGVGRGDPDAGAGGVLSRPRPDRGSVSGVQAGSQGVRSAAAFLTSPIGEQHASVLAIPAKQQEARDLRLAVAGGPRDGSSVTSARIGA
jgi:hypothetical protein